MVALANRNDQLPRGTSFTTPDLVKEYLCAKAAGLEHEVFVALWLNTRHQLIEYEELFRGTIDATAIFPREVVKAALGRNAAAVIFAHNHPSGNATPSAEDRNITARLKQALTLVDVRVLDHVVIGGTTMASMAELGCL